MRHDPALPDARRNARMGLIYGLMAYLWWGFSPLFYKLLSHVPPSQVLANRIIWSAVFFAGMMTLQKRWGEVSQALRTRATLLPMIATTLLVSINWYAFIYAVTSGQVTEGSLGYFMGPIVQVALGVFILKERLRRLQIGALVLAIIGVAIFTIEVGRVPLLAIVLATSFTVYGLIRKMVRVAPSVGTTVETLIAAPVALLFLFLDPKLSTEATMPTHLLLAASGLMTALPLIWFAHSAKLLRLVTLGIVQYVNPTVQFLLAVFVFHEIITTSRIVSFVFIWIALVIYTLDSWHAYRKLDQVLILSKR